MRLHFFPKLNECFAMLLLLIIMQCWVEVEIMSHFFFVYFVAVMTLMNLIHCKICATTFILALCQQQSYKREIQQLLSF